MSGQTPDAGPPTTPERIGIVVGLLGEAEALAPAIHGLPEAERPRLFCSGGDAGRAAVGVEQMLGDGVAALLSFGIAGGLDPALTPGELVVAERVIGPDGVSHASDAGWASALVAPPDAGLAVVPCQLAVLAGVDHPVLSVEAKAALRAKTGAAAVDMESHVVAAAATRAGVPFLAVRAIADPAGRAVPSAALAGLAPDGRPRPFAVAARLTLRPWQIPAILRLARDSAAALAALRGVASRDARRLLRLSGVDLGHELFDVP